MLNFGVHGSLFLLNYELIIIRKAGIEIGASLWGKSVSNVVP